MKRITLTGFLISVFCWLNAQDIVGVKETALITNQFVINLDGKTSGQEFEGFGAVSAGASSRMLFDYPEPYRGEILDYLFKPDFGANILHLKVEIGGDIYSSDGSEPSIAATRNEFNNPKPEYFRRGYEFWLMAEAAKRNPEITFSGLQWGAPAWIGNGNIHSQDNADFIVAWIKGAKRYWGIDIGSVGVWNEHPYDIGYVKLLRKTLDSQELGQVTIDIGDQWQIKDKWKAVDDILADSSFSACVGAINAHTPEWTNYAVPQLDKISQKIWSGESHFYGGNWYAAASWARAYRSYIAGRFTRVLSWSLVSSYPDYLIVPNSGIMKAVWPWSGHYEVLPPVWALAHINQFVKIGWKYIDSGCVWQASEGSLNEGYSVIALKSDKTDDYSVIIETMDAKEPHKLTFRLSGGLSNKPLCLFRSVFKNEEFIRKTDIEVVDGEFSLVIEPNSIYSLSTTRGQEKGVASTVIPDSEKMQLPYSDNFDNREEMLPAKFFLDQHGTFLVSKNPDGKGKCLKQISPQQGIIWWKGGRPITYTGDMGWYNYSVEVDVLLPDQGEAAIHARIDDPEEIAVTSGYTFQLGSDGKWVLKSGKSNILFSGQIPLESRKWQRMKLCCNEKEVSIYLNGKCLATDSDSSYSHGIVALSTGWNSAFFDNIKIMPFK
ncbi:MAG: family 16 glycoside hydrolase [Bacteroidales bacterium]|jgi:galactosylceramidase